MLVTAGLARLLLGMKAGDAQAVDEAAGRLLSQSSHTPGGRVPGLPAAVMLAQATTQFWHGRNEDVGALLALRDWPRAQQCVRTVLTATSALVSRYSLLEAMLCDAQIAQLKSDPGRALEMIAGAIELAQDDIVLPFLAVRDVFASLLARHPAVAAQWPLPPEGVPVDAIMPAGRPVVADLPDPLTEREHAALRFLGPYIVRSRTDRLTLIG